METLEVLEVVQVVVVLVRYYHKDLYEWRLQAVQAVTVDSLVEAYQPQRERIEAV
jgi:hypothetical protein